MYRKQVFERFSKKMVSFIRWNLKWDNFLFFFFFKYSMNANIVIIWKRWLKIPLKLLQRRDSLKIPWWYCTEINSFVEKVNLLRKLFLFQFWGRENGCLNKQLVEVEEQNGKVRRLRCTLNPQLEFLIISQTI